MRVFKAYAVFSILIGFVGSIISQLGDLSASAIKRYTGIIKPLYHDKGEDIVNFVYGEISKICRENHARMLIIILDTEPAGAIKLADLPQKELEKLYNIEYAIVVDGITPLYERLNPKTIEAYHKTYCTPTRNPSVFDGHPNRNAYEVIAQEIVTAIKKAK